MLTMSEKEQVLKRLKGTPEHMLALCMITSYYQLEERQSETQRQLQFQKQLCGMYKNILQGGERT